MAKGGSPHDEVADDPHHRRHSGYPKGHRPGWLDAEGAEGEAGGDACRPARNPQKLGSHWFASLGWIGGRRLWGGVIHNDCGRYSEDAAWAIRDAACSWFHRGPLRFASRFLRAASPFRGRQRPISARPMADRFFFAGPTFASACATKKGA